MAIEDLNTKQELGRWVREFLEGEPLPMNAIEGLEQQLVPGQWQPLELLNSWANVGGGDRGAVWRAIPGNGIQLAGLIAGGAAGSEIALLPAGFHPKEVLVFACSNASDGDGELVVTAGGELRYAGSGQTYVSLTDVIFWAGS